MILPVSRTHRFLYIDAADDQQLILSDLSSQQPAGSHAEAGRPEWLGLLEGGPILPAALAAALPSGAAEGPSGPTTAST